MTESAPVTWRPALIDLPPPPSIALFVQPAVLRVSVQPDLTGMASIVTPPHIADSLESPALSGLDGEVYAVADVDRAPVPVYRHSPRVSDKLRREVGTATVRVQFVVTAVGEIFDPRVMASSNPALEGPTLVALSYWEFIPGKKAGLNVHTRVEQEFRFSAPSPFQR